MSADIVLRDYQFQSIDGLRTGIKADHRVQLLVAATGAGKTVCSAYLLREANRKMSRAIFIVDRVTLVDQTSSVLDLYGIPHGVIQAGHWRYRPHERIQVASAQTLEKRGIPVGVDLVIVDEAHVMRKQTTKFIQSTTARVIGLTATPFTKGMGNVYTNVVNVTTTNQLISEGFLTPIKAYAARAADMTGAKVVAGEWSESDIAKRGTEIIGDIVAEWVNKTQLHFGGPVKTIAFSATVDHGEEICRQFRTAGYNFQQISYRDANDEQRRQVIEEFRHPQSTIHGLVACEVFTRGFDVPDVLCGISARPYRKSLSSHIQQLGRIMRISEGKTYALWLDHSGNFIRFKEDVDRIFEKGVGDLSDCDLDGKARKEPSEKDVSEIKCSCGYVLEPHHKTCPACGKERKRRSLVETLPGEMVSVDGVATSKLPAYLRDREAVWDQLCTWAYEKRQGDDAAARKLALAKFRSWYSAWPSRSFEPNVVTDIDPSIIGRIKHDNIKWARSNSRRAA